jgi:hypothetical protein
LVATGRKKAISISWWLILLQGACEMRINLTYKRFYNIIASSKELYGDNRTDLNHEPVPYGNRNMILK